MFIPSFARYSSTSNLVVGATNEAYFKHIRSLCPEHFLLVPGVGAQGGSLADVYNYGANKDIGLLVNASRSIIFASSGNDFAERAGEEAEKLQNEMAFLMDGKSTKMSY